MADDSKLHTNTPIALTIAGSDSGGGAGIQADLKAFSAMGAYGASVITALTAQNTRAVTAVHDTPIDIIRAQLDAVFDDLPVSAVKIGMLSSPEIIDTVAECLKNVSVPIVLDPVMVAKSGDALLRDEAVATLRSTLVPMATILTPNLPEAARLLDSTDAVDEEAMMEQGNALLALGAKAVLMKGGHACGPECVDVLLAKSAAPVRLRAPRLSRQFTAASSQRRKALCKRPVQTWFFVGPRAGAHDGRSHRERKVRPGVSR